MRFSDIVFIAAAVVLRCGLAQTSGAGQAGAGQPQEVRIHAGPYHPPSATIRVDTNLVDLAVTVRDRKGTPAGGFHASDFQVLDNLKPQTITFFSEQRAESPAVPTAIPSPGEPVSAPTAPAAATPRYLALFFDDTHSGMAGFERSKHAAEKLISGGLQPGDRAGIFTGSGAVTLDFTADAKTLLATLAGMKRHPAPTLARGIGVCPTLTTYQAFVIAKHLDNRAKQLAVQEILACDPGKPYWVAVIEAQEAGDDDWEQLRHEPSNVLDVLILVARHLASEPGARILLMVSPGFLTDGMERQTASLVDICLRNRIVINALDDEGLVSGGGDSPESLGVYNGDRTNWAERTLGQRNEIVQGFMVEATESTGGQFIHNNNDLNRGLQTLAAVPEVSYLLGFSPADQPDGKYHKLKVITTRAGAYEVNARPGYFATPPRKQTETGDKQPETAQQRIDRVVASTETLDEMPAKVKVEAVADKDDRYKIQVDIVLDATSLAFSDLNGASVQQLTFVTVLEDARGNYLEGKQAVMDLNLTGETRADLKAKGIKAATSFFVGKGAYRIREVIREAVQNHTAASSTPVEIR